MPWRTIRAAKKAGVPLSLACALLVTGAPWRQRQRILGLSLVGGLIEAKNVQGAAREISQDPQGLLETMAYFKRLGID